MKELSSRFKRNRFIEVLLFCIWSFNQFLGYSQCFWWRQFRQNILFLNLVFVCYLWLEVCVCFMSSEKNNKEETMSANIKSSSKFFSITKKFLKLLPS